MLPLLICLMLPWSLLSWQAPLAAPWHEVLRGFCFSSRHTASFFVFLCKFKHNHLEWYYWRNRSVYLWHEISFKIHFLRKPTITSFTHLHSSVISDDESPFVLSTKRSISTESLWSRSSPSISCRRVSSTNYFHDGITHTEHYHIEEQIYICLKLW